jgi:hypothetical protein
MITPINNIICGPINAGKNINKLLFEDIDYSFETLPDGFISRNVNLYEKKGSTFSKIINDCQDRVVYEGDKYKDIILSKNEGGGGGEQEEETIYKLIENMENKIKMIDSKIINTYKKSILLDQSLPDDYKEKKTFNKEDQTILSELNKILENFAKDNYTKDNL